MERIAHIPDTLQRKIAWHVLDARIEESLCPLTILQCEEAEEQNHQGLTGDADMLHVCGSGVGIVRSLDVLLPVGKIRPLRMDEVEGYRLRPTKMANGELGLVEIDEADDVNFWQDFFPAGMTSCNAAKGPWGTSHKAKYGCGWSRATIVTREIRMWKVPRLLCIGRGLAGCTAVHVRRPEDDGAATTRGTPQELCTDYDFFNMDCPCSDGAKRLEFLTEGEQKREEELMVQERTL